MHEPSISEYMTASPVVIAPGQSLVEAQACMRENNVRHLPVVEAGRLIGILSDHDLDLLSGVRHLERRRITVERVMTRDPLTVTPEAPLEDVTRLMLVHRCRSAIVVDGVDVVGIFTSVDSLRAVALLLEQLREGGQPEALAPAAMGQL